MNEGCMNFDGVMETIVVLSPSEIKCCDHMKTDHPEPETLQPAAGRAVQEGQITENSGQNEERSKAISALMTKVSL